MILNDFHKADLRIEVIIKYWSLKDQDLSLISIEVTHPQEKKTQLTEIEAELAWLTWVWHKVLLDKTQELFQL